MFYFYAAKKSSEKVNPWVALLMVFGLSLFSFAASGPDQPDCVEDFAFLGLVQPVKAQVDPLNPGAVFHLRAVIEDPFAKRMGLDRFAAWEIFIEDLQGRVVTRLFGSLRLPKGEAQSVWQAWDGRNEKGEILPAGEYRVIFRAREVGPDQVPPKLRQVLFSGPEPLVVARQDLALLAKEWQDSPYEDAVSLWILPEGQEATEALLAAPDKPAEAARTNVPHEAGPYSFWYGNPHSHSTRSDGGGDALSFNCNPSTGRVDMAYPDDAYWVAENLGQMDWLMVSEHNHLIDNAMGNDTLAPTNDAEAIYAQGLSFADAATSANFVGFYGLEWGTISGCGHVIIYDAPHLFNWEAGHYDVLTAACTYDGIGGLYDVLTQNGNQSPTTGLTHATLCHPTANDMFNSYAKDAFSDNAIQGVAVVSGNSSSCSIDFPGGGTTSTPTYKNRLIKLLDVGWRLAPEGHQDNHGDNYGSHSQVRTVILAESLTRECLLRAQNERRFYATQDFNAQLIFTATPSSSSVTHHMGEQINGNGGVNLHVSWSDPDNEEITVFKLLRGQVGAGDTSFSNLELVASGTTGVPTGVVTIDAAENQTGSGWYYLVEIQQVAVLDGRVRHTVSAPIWIDFTTVDDGTVPDSCGCPSAIAAAEQTNLCLGQSTTLSAQVSGGTGPYTYAWTPATGLDDATSPTPLATPSADITYQVVVTDSLTCASEISQISLTVDPGAPPPAATNLVATGSDGQIDLVWDNVLGNGDYQIYRADDCASGMYAWVDMVSATTGQSQVTWTDTPITNGDSFCYQVASDNGSCETKTSDCDPNTCALAHSVAEISPAGASQPLDLVLTGTSLNLAFSPPGPGNQVLLYGADTLPQLTSGDYSFKVCDLENNSEGTWDTDSSAWASFTVSDHSTLPANYWLAVEKATGSEGPYGLNSSGQERFGDGDGQTTQSLGCPLFCATELFFSEYTEGSSNNKAVEIFNGTGAAVDLGTENVTVEFYFNGGTSPGTTRALSGSLAHGEVFVMSDDGASAAILAIADLATNGTFFNGDDAIVLKRGGVVIDVIGQIGVDPGSQWGSGLTSTQDNTLRRKDNVTGGDNDGSDAFDPSVEWDGYAQDDIIDLGQHTLVCP